jgi:cell pole-organizing protein PopZ
MKRAPITFDPTPETNAAAPPKPKAQKTARTARTAPAASETGADTEMLSARVSTAIARQFRSLAKLKGQKVQGMMETALSEYLERNRF